MHDLGPANAETLCDLGGAHQVIEIYLAAHLSTVTTGGDIL
jgi:hypothetical protein